MTEKVVEPKKVKPKKAKAKKVVASDAVRPQPKDIDGAISDVHDGKKWAAANKKLEKAQDEHQIANDLYFGHYEKLKKDKGPGWDGYMGADEVDVRTRIYKDMLKAEKKVERVFKGRQKLIDDAVKAVAYPKITGKAKIVTSESVSQFKDLWKDVSDKKSAGQAVIDKGRAGLDIMLSKKVIDSVPEVKLYCKKGRRAGYSATTNNIGIGRQDTGTLIHEFGHAVEFNYPGAQDAAVAFRKMRVGDEAISEIYKGSKEMGWKDEFFNHYVGKDYTKQGSPKATEIISMGLQEMHNNPSGFYSSDPEYFDFIQKIMWGDL